MSYKPSGYQAQYVNMRNALIIIVLPFVFGLVKAQDHSSYYTEPYHKKVLEIYRTSIGFRTTETHGQVPVFANYLADEFHAGGFADEDIHALSSAYPSRAKISRP